MIQIAYTIREIRQNQAYSQEFMATTLGIHTSNYNRIETGVQQPSLARILEIARILNVQPFELFLDNTWRNRIEQAQANEQRLKQLEMELVCLRQLLLEKTEAQMLNSQWSNALKNESGFQNFVS